jgi:hypothetical protein
MDMNVLYRHLFLTNSFYTFNLIETLNLITVIQMISISYYFNKNDLNTLD